MPIDKVWVLAESADGGGPTPVTLELLTEARAVGSTVEALAWGADAASLAASVGSTARPRSTMWATSVTRCRACRSAAALAALH